MCFRYGSSRSPVKIVSPFSPFIFPLAEVCVSRRYCITPTRNPAVPHEGSATVSVGSGSSISTMKRMMCLGVRNWPLMPAVVSFESRYS